MRTGSSHFPLDPSRRRALQLLFATCAGTLAACAPVRIGLGAYPRAFKSGAAGRTHATLEAFAGAVVPGLTTGGSAAARMQDPAFGFAPYAGFFASELDRAAQRRHGESFTALRAGDQRTIVAAGLEAGGIPARLFTGAVFLAQVLSYAGAEDDTGSPLLDFPGANRAPSPGSSHYVDLDAFRATAFTPDGNPA